MNDILKESDIGFQQQIMKYFGNHIEPYLDELLNDFSMVVAAKLMAGANGDNPLCKLNRALKGFDKTK